MSESYKEHCEEAWTTVRNPLKFSKIRMYMGPEGYKEVEDVYPDAEDSIRSYRISQHEAGMRGTNFFVVETKTYGDAKAMRILHKERIHDVKLTGPDALKRQRIVITCLTQTGWRTGPERAALEFQFIFSNEESAFDFMRDIMCRM